MLSTDKQTDKQTDRQTNQRYQKHNLLCQGGNELLQLTEINKDTFMIIDLASEIHTIELDLV